MNERDQSDKEGLENWEGFDPELSVAENFLELQIQMGFLDDAKAYLNSFTLHRDSY